MRLAHTLALTLGGRGFRMRFYVLLMIGGSELDGVSVSPARGGENRCGEHVRPGYRLCVLFRLYSETSP